MDVQIDLTGIVSAVLALLAALITYRLVPYIKSKTNEKEFNEIQMWVKIAVEAAEMIFKETGMGAEKKQYVVDFLEQHGYTIDFDELDNMIEAAVLELNNEKVEKVETTVEKVEGDMNE